MTKQTIKTGISTTQVMAIKAVRVAKISAIVAVVLLSLVGAYVVATPDLRNTVVDYAQNQHPKAQ